MEVKAKLKFARISPRKARLVADIIRGLDVQQAIEQLSFVNKKAAPMILKLVNSAVANAENNFELAKDNLYIKTITVDDGPIYYRWMPRAFGRATRLRKRSAHIIVVLSEKVASQPKKKDQKAKPASATVAKKDVKNTPDAKKVETKDQTVEKNVEQGNEPEPFDVRSQGKHRNVQHQDKKNAKDKGFLNKMFRRKSGQ